MAKKKKKVSKRELQEAKGPIFKAATPEQIKRRKVERIGSWNKDFKLFQQREDVIRQADGSYIVGGDVEDLGSSDYKRLSVKYRVVGGNFSCGSGSLKGAPQAIGGDFHFHGELKSLKEFPKVVGGDVVFINHPIPGNNPNAKRWTIGDIKKVCKAIGGRLVVENHYGI